MADTVNIERARDRAEALDRVAGVAPPADSGNEDHPTTHVRDAKDADDHKALKHDPGDEDAKLEVGLDESFPTSDPPAIASPGGGEPAPSSGYDAEAEERIAAQRKAAGK